MILSPLAAEILTDLKAAPDPALQDGASLKALRAWLGEPIPALRAAIEELKRNDLIHSYQTRIYAGRKPTRGRAERC